MANRPELLRNRGKSDRRSPDRDYDAIELHDINQPTRHEDMETIISRQSQPIAGPDQPPAPEQGLDTSNLPFIYKHSSILLENKGSVARDHLANERTCLAWIRTGSVFVTLGVTFIQFVHLANKTTSVTIDGKEYDLSEFNANVQGVFDKYARVIEVLSIVLGILAVVFAGYRYLHVQTLLTRDYFPASRIKVATIVAVNLAMLILLLLLDVNLYR